MEKRKQQKKKTRNASRSSLKKNSLHANALMHTDVSIHVYPSCIDTDPERLTSVKNDSIPSTPPRRGAPGPAERAHRLRSQERKPHQWGGARVCQDGGKVEKVP